MTKMTNRRFGIYVIWLLFAVFALCGFYYQNTGGTLTAQQASHNDTCTGVTASGASPQTLTIPQPPTGQSVYLSELDMGLWTTAAPSAGAATITAAGFPNNDVYTFEFPATANLNVNPAPITWPTGKKASVNTSVTFTGSTVASVSEYIHACYWFSQ